MQKYDDSKIYDPPENYELSDKDKAAIKELRAWGKKYKLGLFSWSGILHIIKSFNGASISIGIINDIWNEGGDPDSGGVLPDDYNE